MPPMTWATHVLQMIGNELRASKVRRSGEYPESQVHQFGWGTANSLNRDEVPQRG